MTLYLSMADDPFQLARDGWGYDKDKMGEIVHRALDAATRRKLRRRASLDDTKRFVRSVFLAFPGVEVDRARMVGSPLAQRWEHLARVGSIIENLMVQLARAAEGEPFKPRKLKRKETGGQETVPGDVPAVEFLTHWFAGARWVGGLEPCQTVKCPPRRPPWICNQTIGREQDGKVCCVRCGEER